MYATFDVHPVLLSPFAALLSWARLESPLEVVLGRGRSQGPKRDLGPGEIQVPRIQQVLSRTWPCEAGTRT